MGCSSLAVAGEGDRAASAGWWRGPAGCGLIDDMSQHAVEIAKDRLRRDAEREHAALRKPRIAEGIAGRSVATVVKGAIDLDRKLCERAVEVEAVWPGGVLAAKVEAAG